jgi:hypothetical protein
MWRSGRRDALRINIFVVSLLFAVRASGLQFWRRAKTCRSVQRYLEAGIARTGAVGRAPVSANANKVLR